MADYGALGDVVAASGSLIGAATAIGLAWKRRSKWMPPEEAVPDATAKVSSLICAVAVGIIYINRIKIGPESMSAISIVCLISALLCLIVSIFINTVYSFEYYASNDDRKSRILGGLRLTREARHIAKTRHLEVHKLFENANFDRDLVWTRPSRALTAVISTLGYIGLLASGSIALASTAILMSLPS
ncbi:hypothetical protein ACLBXO_28675 [Methylobacterium sp. C33D]